jgi:GTP-binding protein EngB required for normal cell division
MIAKSKQFQPSLKYLCGFGYWAVSLNAASTMKTVITRFLNKVEQSCFQ